LEVPISRLRRGRCSWTRSSRKRPVEGVMLSICRVRSVVTASWLVPWRWMSASRSSNCESERVCGCMGGIEVSGVRKVEC